MYKPKIHGFMYKPKFPLVHQIVLHHGYGPSSISPINRHVWGLYPIFRHTQLLVPIAVGCGQCRVPLYICPCSDTTPPAVQPRHFESNFAYNLRWEFLDSPLCVYIIHIYIYILYIYIYVLYIYIYTIWWLTYPSEK